MCFEGGELLEANVAIRHSRRGNKGVLFDVKFLIRIFIAVEKYCSVLTKFYVAEE